MATPEVGQTIAGKYRVERILGAGGMGIVAGARHLELDEPVAIKFLRHESIFDAPVRQRFVREAKAAVRIKGEHVARILDVGTHEDGTPFMVMEYLDGEDLHHRVKRTGPLPVPVAVDFMLQVCEALAEAHALGIVHRDLKPANLFVVFRPNGPLVKVLDFGISKVKGQDHGTSTGAVFGSPLYMSPEQLSSARDVDERTDIWALGVTLYELVTGTNPFGGSLGELVLRVMTQPPVPLVERLPDAPPGFGEVIEKCLEKERGDRYRTVGQFAEALAPFVEATGRFRVGRIARVLSSAGLGHTVRVPDQKSEPEDPEEDTETTNAGTETTPTITAWDRLSTVPRRSRWAVIIVAIVAIAGFVALRVMTQDAPGTVSSSQLAVFAPASAGELTTLPSPPAAATAETTVPSATVATPVPPPPPRGSRAKRTPPPTRVVNPAPTSSVSAPSERVAPGAGMYDSRK